jgi:SAM-dependent methyltransferase
VLSGKYTVNVMQQVKEIEKALLDYYKSNLDNHGPGAMGVGWKSEMAQQIRFEQLIKIIGAESNFSINDMGCGVGDFYIYLSGKSYGYFDYYGYDMLESMLALAKAKFASEKNIHWIKVDNASDLHMADYTIASGIFNLKYSIEESEWLKYIIETLGHINKKSKRGFAFNMLTAYADKEYMKEHLFYSDPLFFFDLCKKHFSKNVALLHDYYEYDFTILVRK